MVLNSFFFTKSNKTKKADAAKAASVTDRQTEGRIKPGPEVAYNDAPHLKCIAKKDSEKK